MDIPRKSNPRARRIRQAIVVVVAVLVVGGVTLGLRRLKPAAPLVDAAALWTDTVKSGPMTREVRAPGTLEPEHVWWIPAATEGRIERILVQPGTQVTPETVLVELSNPQLSRDLTDAEWQVKSLEAERELLEVQMRTRKLDLESVVAVAEANLREAEMRSEVSEMLGKDGLVSKLDLKLSRVRLEQLQKVYEVEKSRLSYFDPSAKAELAAKDARVEQAKIQLGLRREQAASLSVRAGLEGVLEQMDIEVGQHVTPGTTLAKVSDPKHLKAVLHVAQVQAPEVTPGQTVQVDTRNGIVQGRVARVNPSVVDGTVAVEVTLAGEPPRGARSKLSVEGTVELEHMERVLHVGRPAQVQPNSTIGLFKVVEGGAEASRVTVRVGRTSVSEVEIVDGLVEGDKVVLSDMQQWDQHDRVRLK